MHFILEPIFTLFGKRAIGQLVGSTVIGAILPALTLLRNGQIPPGDLLSWTLGGAIAGLVAGLFLLSPTRFFGSIFTVVGLAIIAAPMSRADGSPAGLQAHLIKLSVGVVLFSLGVLFLVRAWRRLRSMTSGPDQGPAANRRFAGQSDDSGSLSAIVAGDRAFRRRSLRLIVRRRTDTMAWFADTNLQAVCEIIAEYAGCELSEAEWDAIRFGVEDTHTEAGKWFDWCFEGDAKVSFRLGYDEPGTGVIFLEHSAQGSIGAKLDAVLDLAQRRTISRLYEWRE